MNITLQNKINTSDSLKARKDHLIELIKIIKPRTGNSTHIETLTIDAINAEINIVENQLEKWK